MMDTPPPGTSEDSVEDRRLFYAENFLHLMHIEASA